VWVPDKRLDLLNKSSELASKNAPMKQKRRIYLEGGVIKDVKGED